MAIIRIRENDSTTAGALSTAYDVAYIPGFGDLATIQEDPEDDPKMCYTITEFQSYFGSNIPRFEAETTITYYQQTSSTPKEYAVKFEKGAPDPSYVMAMELLSAGMPVCYQKVNSFENGIKDLGAEGQGPDSGSTNKFTVEYIAQDQDHLAPLIIDTITIKNETETETDATTFSPSITKSETAENTYIFTITYTGELSGSLKLMNVKFRKGTKITAQAMYNALLPASGTSSSVMEKIKDRGSFNVKYITTGGYPSYEYQTGSASTSNKLYSYVLSVAASLDNDDRASSSGTIAVGRGDAIALIDHCNYSSRPLTGDNSVFKDLNIVGDNAAFGAMFTPWCVYTSTATAAGNIALPASFAYLKAVAKFIRTGNSNWYAIANTARGQVDLVKPLTDKTLTNSIANLYQVETGSTGNSINAITYISPYGYCIWGNRTLKSMSNTSYATCFLNTRSVLCDIKKVVYRAAKRYMFDPNTETLWINFSSQITDVLERMKSSSAISGYSIKRDKAASGRTKLVAKITIYPVYAVESFDISISVSDEDISVTGA